MKAKLLILSLLAALLAAPTAMATGGNNGRPEHPVKPGYQTICKKVSNGKLWPHKKYVWKCETRPAPKPKPKPEPPTTDGPPRGDSSIVVQENRTGYCFQTSTHGWTYINLVTGDVIAEGHVWYDLYVAKASVTVDGKTVTFAGWEDWRADGGILEAPFVEGVGQTCDNPHVK